MQILHFHRIITLARLYSTDSIILGIIYDPVGIISGSGRKRWRVRKRICVYIYVYIYVYVYICMCIYISIRFDTREYIGTPRARIFPCGLFRYRDSSKSSASNVQSAAGAAAVHDKRIFSLETFGLPMFIFLSYLALLVAVRKSVFFEA